MKYMYLMLVSFGMVQAMEKAPEDPKKAQAIEKKEKPSDSKDSKESKPNAFVRAITCCCSNK